MKPRKITPSLINTFLLIAGYALVQSYSTQALKLARVLYDDMIPLFPVASLPSTTKLQLFLEETVLATGKFPVPVGQKMKDN